jgi:tRNA modification GTPase
VFSTTDTIVAVATPSGRGAIGVVRVSGRDALDIARRLTGRMGPFAPRQATLAQVGARHGGEEERLSRRGGERDDSDAVLPAPGDGWAPADQVIVTTFPGPASYTGEDVAEISAHGSPVVLQGIVAAAMRLGARLAEPGEFTLRAFLNGRVDLPQAEAVADLIDAVTPAQARVAFDQLQGTLTRAIAGIDAELFDLAARLEASVDFPEEGYHFIEPEETAARLEAVCRQIEVLLSGARRGRMIREGCLVAIVGRPNAGKSSLFNALVGADRAIVTPVPGTTRDLVTEAVDVQGIRVTFVDTAGLRDASDVVEAEGVSRTRGAARAADLVIEVVDGAGRDEDGPPPGVGGRTGRVVRVSAKADLPDFAARAGSVVVSAATGLGLDDLRREIVGALGAGIAGDTPAISNLRHIGLLTRGLASIARARRGVTEGRAPASEEFILADLAEARAALEEISGKRTSDAVLRQIFERFCVGK